MAIDFTKYEDSYLILKRAGTQSDPYVEKNEYITVINNIAVLSEIPARLNHVIIPNFTEIFLNSWETLEEPAENTFIVDYTTGRLIFNSAHNGEVLHASYHGTGVILTFASRIVLADSTPEAVTTLQDIINTAAKSITFHNTSPNQEDGKDGDIWFIYDE